MNIDKKLFYKKMRGAAVGVAGLGGLGSNLALALARTNIGKLTLVDFDRVEKSNLNRQQYFLSQVGDFKTDALKKNILEINPNVEIKTVNYKLNKKNIPEIFSDNSPAKEKNSSPLQAWRASLRQTKLKLCSNIKISRLSATESAVSNQMKF